jgi:hypothetical protein
MRLPAALRGRIQSRRLLLGRQKKTSVEARLISPAFNKGVIPENYSPTPFLLYAMLPDRNQNRTMDYVATLCGWIEMISGTS